MALSDVQVPCPICFEPSESPTCRQVSYSTERNHSWSNLNACDAHGICWSCLAKHIEIQVLSEGKWNVRCPGEGCRYHLLQQDMQQALQGSDVGAKVLETLMQLRDHSCQDRLKQLVCGTACDRAEHWVLQECQPCPKCFVIARRETGCDHIVCRCGCHFCFTCGAPQADDPEAGCLCEYLKEDCKDGQVYFAAWLRSAWTSPCEWLWEEVQEEPQRFISTLAFWLWTAGAHVEPPASWDGCRSASTSNNTNLRPLQWAGNTNDWDLDDFYFRYFLSDIYDIDLDMHDNIWIADMYDVTPGGYIPDRLQRTRRHARGETPIGKKASLGSEDSIATTMEIRLARRSRRARATRIAKPARRVRGIVGADLEV